MALSFAHSTRLIGVPQADAQPLLMQALIDAIRDEEASERGIVEPAIADASGKDALGSGVTTGITVSLRSSWLLSFAPGPYQATVSGGNLSDALARIANTGSPQVLINSSAASTAVATSGSSGPSAPAIAAAVVDSLNATTIPVDTRRMNGAPVVGDGSPANKWRGAGV